MENWTIGQWTKWTKLTLWTEWIGTIGQGWTKKGPGLHNCVTLFNEGLVNIPDSSPNWIYSLQARPFSV